MNDLSKFINGFSDEEIQSFSALLQQIGSSASTSGEWELRLWTRTDLDHMVKWSKVIGEFYSTAMLHSGSSMGEFVELLFLRQLTQQIDFGLVTETKLRYLLFVYRFLKDRGLILVKLGESSEKFRMRLRIDDQIKNSFIYDDNISQEVVIADLERITLDEIINLNSSNLLSIKQLIVISAEVPEVDFPAGLEVKVIIY